ncbi:MAG: hypothetical protein ACYCSN_05520 [Acidobacteriaceae bacterium]
MKHRSICRGSGRKGPVRDTVGAGGTTVTARSASCRKFHPDAVGKKENASEYERVEPETAYYRKYTEGMLRRYMRMSLEMGRVPSMLGKELFRGKVTSYRVKSFEDVIIFVHDVEKCLALLDATSIQLIGRISLQEYTQGEAAGLTGMSLRSVTRKYAVALDRLTVLFLRHDLLERQTEMGCQRRRPGK